MEPPIKEFVTRLRGLKPTEDDDNLQSTLYELVAPVEALDASRAIPDIFQFFEEFPDADHGTPGPLVHLLEKYPGIYEAELKASMERRPSPHAVWMTNRILNTELDETARISWMEILRSTLDHPRATASARDHAELFIQHQQTQED
jgi:hypothetical protein